MLLPALSPTLGSFHRVSWHCFLQHGPAKAPLSSSSMGSLHSLAAMYSQEDELTHGRSGAANAIRTTGDNGDRQDRRQQRSKAARILMKLVRGYSSAQSVTPQYSAHHCRRHQYVRVQIYGAEDKYLLQAYTLHSCTVSHESKSFRPYRRSRRPLLATQQGSKTL